MLRYAGKRQRRKLGEVAGGSWFSDACPNEDSAVGVGQRPHGFIEPAFAQAGFVHSTRVDISVHAWMRVTQLPAGSLTLAFLTHPLSVLGITTLPPVAAATCSAWSRSPTMTPMIKDGA